MKHALRGKEGKRNLWIAADRREGGVCIRITDNGGGYHPESRNRGTGTGMKVIMQTIQILNMKIRLQLIYLYIMSLCRVVKPAVK